jgi:hypothetical protein
MEPDLATLIRQVQQGNTDAYEPIVQRFQDMAVGYRIQRKRQAILRLDMLANVAGERQNPVELLEQQEVRDAVITAMQCLPDAQRLVDI